MKLVFYDLNVKTMILIGLGMEKIKRIRLRLEIITSKELRLAQIHSISGYFQGTWYMLHKPPSC